MHADQDSVRLLAVQCCGALARTLSKAECLATVVPVVQRFAQVLLLSLIMLWPCGCSHVVSNGRKVHLILCLIQDKSWRVRYNVAQQLYMMCISLGAEASR